MRATQYDLNITNQNVAQATSEISQSATRIQSLVTGTGALLDENGNLIVDGQGNPIFTTDGSGLYSKQKIFSSRIIKSIPKLYIHAAFMMR